MASPSAVALKDQASPSAVALEDQGNEQFSAVALEDQGNEQFKAGNYLKAAAFYTQAIKLDPDNATLYSNQAAAFLQLVKLSKALADAETTVKLKPQWEKAHFRKGCVLEAMECYEEAIAAFQIALQKRALDVENMCSNVDIAKNLESLKTELDMFLEKELLADPKSRGKEAFAYGNYFEALYYGLDSPPPREEIVMVGSGGISGFSGYHHHGGGRGGLLDVLEETLSYSVRGGGGLLDILDEGVNHMVAPTKLCTWFQARGGGLLNILDEGVNHMVAPTKLCTWFQAPFHGGGHGQGEERALISGLCDLTTPDYSSFVKKGILPWPLPRPYPKPRPEDVRIQPKPMTKISELFKAIQRTFNKFFFIF